MLVNGQCYFKTNQLIVFFSVQNSKECDNASENATMELAALS